MAKLNNYLSILVALLAAIMQVSMVARPVAADEVELDITVTIPPEPEPGFYKTIEECAKAMSRECGEVVVKSVIENKDTTKKCCGELVNRMGKTCHDDLLKFYVSLPELGLNATLVYARGEEVWNNCVSITKSKI